MIDPRRLVRLLDDRAAALELYAAQWTECPADVVQEAFIRLAAQTQIPENVVPWLYRVVRNMAISARRSTNRRRRHEAAAASQSESWFLRSDGDEIDARAAAKAVGELEDNLREVVVARIWGGLTFDEIAELVDASSSTVHRRYEAALQQLRTRIEGQWLNHPATLRT